MAISNTMNRNIETKTSVQTSSDGAQIFHNDFITRSTNLINTSQGTGDPVINASANRIGDKINLSGVSIKIMLELNERYSVSTLILASKTITIRQQSTAINPSGIQEVGSGFKNRAGPRAALGREEIRAAYDDRDNNRTMGFTCHEQAGHAVTVHLVRAGARAPASARL